MRKKYIVKYGDITIEQRFFKSIIIVNIYIEISDSIKAAVYSAAFISVLFI